MIPTVADRDAMLQTDLYREMAAFSDDWRQRHHQLLKPYGNAWCADPLRAWSRQWEYPWAVQRLKDWYKKLVDSHLLCEVPYQLRFLDAGSGVTFLPFYLRNQWHADVTCVDIAMHWVDLILQIETGYIGAVPGFVYAQFGDLARLPFEDYAFDAAVCISVLEHTPAPLAGLAELQRVVRPGGLLVCTWDIAADRNAYPDTLRYEHLVVNGLAVEV